MRKACGVLVGVLVVLVPIGCGSDTGLDLAYVQGKVTYKGQPVQNGSIVFEPDTAKNTRGPTGMSPIDKDGNYVLSTSSGGDGAVVGFHKVGITGLEPEPISAAGEKPPSPETDALGYLKGKAKAAKQSTRKATAKGDTFTDRGGRTFRYVTPKKLSEPAESGIAVEVGRGSNRIDFEVAEDGTLKVNQ